MKTRYIGLLAALCSVLAMSSGSVWAGFTGSSFPTPQLQGPSRIKAGQTFQLSFNYSPAVAKRDPQTAWDMEIYVCESGVDKPPANLTGDTSQETFPTSSGATCSIAGPNAQGVYFRKAFSTFSGHQVIDMQPYMPGVYGDMTHQSTKTSLNQWLRGTTWYVRVRFASPASGMGPWSQWHKTAIASGITLRAMGAGSLNLRAKTDYRLLLRGLKPPVIKQPTQNAVERGSSIKMVFQLPKHSDYSNWICCDKEFQRATVVTKQNLAYVNQHHGMPKASEPKKPWDYPYSYARTFEKNSIHPGSDWVTTPSSDLFRPHSLEFGYRYWMRVREEYLPHGYPNSSDAVYGPWSDWRVFTVQEPIQVHVVSPVPKATRNGYQQRSSGQTGSQMQRRRSLPAVQEHTLTLPSH